MGNFTPFGQPSFVNPGWLHSSRQSEAPRWLGDFRPSLESGAFSGFTQVLTPVLLYVAFKEVAFSASYFLFENKAATIPDGPSQGFGGRPSDLLLAEAVPVLLSMFFHQTLRLWQ
jgi:hypothetical protein